MSNDLEKIAAVEAAAAAKLKAIRQKRKAIERAKNEEKIKALGAGVQRAIKAGDMQWPELKTILSKHIKNKKERALLNLPDSIQENA